MIDVKKTCFLVILLLSFAHTKLHAQASYDWFKGWWQYYSITPDTMRGQTIESELDITSVTGNEYSGTQKIWCSNDTLSMVRRECSGFFTDGDISFLPEDEVYRKEPQEVHIWNGYTKYVVEKTYFSISHNKLILHIKVKSMQSGFVKEFAYYRDLMMIPFSIRTDLQKRYGSPQLVDKTDTVKVIVVHLEPDENDTVVFTGVIPGNSSLPPEIISRKNTLVKTMEVNSSDVQIILLDDAEIDGDIISLYHNNELVLDHKTIGKEMVKYSLKADAEHPHHEFTLVAENLGSIPPNTALVRIRAGELKYEFIVHSDLHENVKFVINYVGDKKIDITAPK